MGDNLTNEAEIGILDHIHGVATYTITTPLKLALLTTVPTDATPGSEVSGGSYARQTIACAAAVSGSTSNTGAATFSAMPACTIAGFAVYDSSATPKRIWHGPTSTTKTLAAGDSYTVPIGSLVLSLS